MDHITDTPLYEETPADTGEALISPPTEDPPLPTVAEPPAEAEPTQEPTAPEALTETDYEALAASDLVELRRLIPSLHIQHIGELPGAVRYGELRDRGLSVEEAFWAACHSAVAAPASRSYDNRSHLHSAVPRGATGNPAVMTAAELRAAKELFEDLSDSELQKLYAKCRS